MTEKVLNNRFLGEVNVLASELNANHASINIMFASKFNGNPSGILTFWTVGFSPASGAGFSCAEDLCSLVFPVVFVAVLNAGGTNLRPKPIVAPVTSVFTIPSVPPPATVAIPKTNNPTRLKQIHSTDEIFAIRISKFRLCNLLGRVITIISSGSVNIIDVDRMGNIDKEKEVDKKAEVFFDRMAVKNYKFEFEMRRYKRSKEIGEK